MEDAVKISVLGRPHGFVSMLLETGPLPVCMPAVQPAHEVRGSVEVLARCMSLSPEGACHPLPTRVLPPQCQEEWEKSQPGSPVPVQRLLIGAGAGRRYAPAGILGDVGCSSGTMMFSFIVFR